LTLQQCPDDLQLIPRYDQALLRRELTIFSEWFVEQLLEYSLNIAEQALLERTFIQLEKSALEQPQVLVHRDYHSRNLLVCESGAVGVIDFQGALWGPCTYDAVSLLRDCYLRWPEEDVQRWALSFGNMAMDAGLLPAVDTTTYLRWFDWMGLQRHIKVLGIFARLHLRDSKPHYLGDLSRVLGYVLDVAAGYQELAEFTDWFRRKILPLAAQQPWYVAADLPLGHVL
jgi:aminoglycoside/choline kinase family phosphotransferase